MSQGGLRGMDKEEARRKIKAAFDDLSAFEAAIRSSRKNHYDNSESDFESLSSQETNIVSE